MSVRIELPMLVSSRDEAAKLVSISVPDDIQGQSAFVLSRALEAAAPSFTDELVKQLTERHAKEIVLIGAPPQFISEAEESAGRYPGAVVRPGAAIEIPV